MRIKRVIDIRYKAYESERVIMELTGKLKELVDKAETREEAKKVIEEAGISLTDEELYQVSGGTGKGNVTTDCYFCGKKHDLICRETGMKIIPRGLKKMYDGASKYFCTNLQKNFYVLPLPNGGIAILDDDLKIVR